MNKLHLDSGLTVETGLVDQLIEETINGKREWKISKNLDEFLFSLSEEFNVSFCPFNNSFGETFYTGNIFAGEKGSELIHSKPGTVLWDKLDKLRDIIYQHNPTIIG